MLHTMNVLRLSCELSFFETGSTLWRGRIFRSVRYTYYYAGITKEFFKNSTDITLCCLQKVIDIGHLAIDTCYVDNNNYPCAEVNTCYIRYTVSTFASITKNSIRSQGISLEYIFRKGLIIFIILINNLR